MLKPWQTFVLHLSESFFQLYTECCLRLGITLQGSTVRTVLHATLTMNAAFCTWCLCPINKGLTLRQEQVFQDFYNVTVIKEHIQKHIHLPQLLSSVLRFRLVVSRVVIVQQLDKQTVTWPIGQFPVMSPLNQPAKESENQFNIAVPVPLRWRLSNATQTYPTYKHKLQLVKVSNLFRLSRKLAIFILATLFSVHFNILQKNGVKLATLKISYINQRKWRKLVLMNNFCVQDTNRTQKNTEQSYSLEQFSYKIYVHVCTCILT